MAGRRRKNYHNNDCRCDGCLAEAYGYDWRQLVPGAGWLRDYMHYALEVTDAPPIYHVASGLACLATVVGANCIFQPTPDDQPIPLNMWILTAGTSAKQRKSTAVNLVKKVLKKNFSYFLVPWSGSPEAIYSKIAQQPQCVMVIPEFPSFLAQLDQKYARSMKTQLMDLFDGESSGRVTRGKGEEKIEDPRINMIGGAALDLLDKHLRDLDFRSGFLSRMFFVAGDRKKWMRRPRQYPDDLRRLQNGLLQIAKWSANQRVLRASKEADDALGELALWVENRGNDVEYRSYGSIIDRNATHAHKIAALYSASMQHATVYSSLVRKRVVPMTKQCIDVIEEYLINMMSDSDFVRAAQAIKMWLREAKYRQGDLVPFREIVRRSVDVRHAQAAVEQLESEEILSKVQGSKQEGEARATNKAQLLVDPKTL